MKQFLIQNLLTRSFYYRRRSDGAQLFGSFKDADVINSEEEAEAIIQALLPNLPDFKGVYYQDPYVLTIIPVFIR